MIDLFILMVVVIGLSLAVYHIAQYSTKETSFEQAIQEQRQKRHFDNPTAKNEKDKKKIKIKKPKTKKEEAETVSVTQNSEAARKPTDEVPTKPIIEETTEIPTNNGPLAEQKKKKKKEVEVVKPILEAKNSNTLTSAFNTSLVAQPAAANPAKMNSVTDSKASKNAVNHKQQNKVAKAPMVNGPSTTVVDGNKSTSNKKVSSPSKEKRHETITNSTPTLLEEQMQLIELQMQSVQEKKKKPKPEPEKKIKTKSLTDDTLQSLLPIIHKSHLSGNEVQMLIDTLLNKQQATGEWVEKGRCDPLQQLKKTLEEAESKLVEQTEAQEALQAKITGLRTDLNGERSKSSSLKKKLDGSEALMLQKLEAATLEHKNSLNAKINETKKSLEKDFQAKMSQLKQTSKSDSELKVKQLEMSVLEAEKQVQQTKAANNQGEQTQQKLEVMLQEAEVQLQQAVESRDQMVTTCQKYQNHIIELKEQASQQDQSLNARVAEMQQSLAASEEVKCQFKADREQLKQQLKNLEGVKELLTQNQVKLKETVREKCEIEVKSEKEICAYEETISNQKEQMERLIEEKESLASQSVRPAAEGRENGDIHQEQINTNNNLSAEYEEKLNSLTKEISRLKEEVSFTKRKNDELRNKNHKVMEALGITEKSLTKKLEEKNKHDQETQITKQMLHRIFPSINVVGSLEEVLKQVETAAIAAQTTEVKPEIVEKIVEKIVQDPALAKKVEDLESENGDLYKQVEKLTSEILEMKKNDSHSSDSEKLLSDLEVENKSLEDKVTHYQNVLSNTECLLKTLQSSVESEEAGWKEKFVEKEEQIVQLTADKANLSLTVAELQSTIDKVKQAEEMDSQLTSLKEKLDLNEKENGDLKDQLHKAQEQLKANSLSQSISANGPANGVDNHEDTNSLAETSSLVSASSASVSEGLDAQTESSSKKKKKKKNFLSKLIG